MDYKDIEEINEMSEEAEEDFKLPWHKKLLIKLSPKLLMKAHARKLDLSGDFIEYAEKLFANKKIHIEPLHGTGGRGFIICIDNKLTLWFYQDSDCFKYDGFEIGEYDDGEVTVFDRLKR